MNALTQDRVHHNNSLRLGIASVTTELQTILGQRLTALVAGVKDVQSVGLWSKGRQVPRGDHEWRLRLAYRITKMLLASEAPETVRAWFVGVDPLLEDRAPALVIADARQGDELEAARVLRAARAFSAE
ncbi:MAG: XRE family transcriptional regulator [Chloroflexi bacterium]|nr:XRE family transcriptional regulator [Chloroflexota bacterium]